jgi:hypothetical protein
MRRTRDDIILGEQERLALLVRWQGILARPGVLDSVTGRQQLVELVQQYYEETDKGHMLTPFAGDVDDNATLAKIREQQDMDPANRFIKYLGQRSLTEARYWYSRVLSRLEMDIAEQQDYIAKLQRRQV